MNVPLVGLCFATAALGIAGCAAPSEQVTVLKPVNAAPLVSAARARPGGHLVAYTPVILPPLNSTTLFYPHSSYAIYDRQGNLVREVRNHVGAWDETPERINLPAGRYTVRAQSDSPGTLEVPVIIRRDQTTVIDLARGNRYFVTAVNPG